MSVSGLVQAICQSSSGGWPRNCLDLRFLGVYVTFLSGPQVSSLCFRALAS